MPYSQQRIHSLNFTLLKNLRDVEITFKENGLTGILGPNGSGKSSILHALCCLYQPNDGQPSFNFKFSQFFTPTTHTIWTGSSFTMRHTYREGANPFSNIDTMYSKQIDRWAPKYSRRPKRHVSFIGIKTCVPAIESETQVTRIQFNTTPLNDALSLQILNLGGRVMNRNYTDMSNHTTASSKRYLGLSFDGIDYSSLNMGAGEQRILLILSQILNTPNYGLILIDEIDLLLHEDALKRLLEVLKEIALEKHLQIIFTTHNHNILKVNDIEYRHIQQTAAKTICHIDSNPEALYRLTGVQIKPYELFVEDDLTKFISKQVAHNMGLGRETEVRKFGPAINCFTAACGALLNETDNFENMSFILDGDVYRTEDEKRIQINRVLTGNVANFDTKRTTALSKITQLNIPENITPERYYRNLIVALPNDTLNAKQLELKQILEDIVNPPNDHDFISILVDRIGLEEGEVLTLLTDMLALTDDWDIIIVNIRDWFNQKKV
ncbi:MAG: AAA family ATPase [Saprospiraceae bacterium]|nr:AAA family ATPase [Saprospiraceae bacterium]MBK9630999.1 AAA family ATPase [Saprospiraceae bacterium]